jgi:hypothetical protein
MSSNEIWYVKSWEVLSEKVDEHEELQRQIWNASLERFPEMRGKYRYLVEKNGSSEIRHIIFTGSTELAQYQSIEKRSEEDPYLAELFEKFYPLTVPDSAKKQVWVDGVTWEE